MVIIILCESDDHYGDNRQIWLIMFISLLPNSQTLDYLFGWILLFCLANERNRTKVTRHTNEVYKLYAHLDTSNA